MVRGSLAPASKWIPRVLRSRLVPAGWRSSRGRTELKLSGGAAVERFEESYEYLGPAVILAGPGTHWGCSTRWLQPTSATGS